MILDDVPVPRFKYIKDPPALRWTTFPGHIIGQLDKPEFAGKVQAGQRIGITVGSRGVRTCP